MKISLRYGLLAFFYCNVIFFALTYQGVAHQAYASVKKLQLVLFLLFIFAGFFLYRFRYFVFLLTAFLTPRIFSISIGIETHAIIFPQILGLGIGILSNRIWFAKEQLKPLGKETSTIAFLILFIIAYTYRSLIELYSISVFEQGMIDREYLPGISANYSWFLAVGLALNLLPAFLFLYVDKSFESQEAEETSIVGKQFVYAFIVIALVNVIVATLQYLGFQRLSLGAGDFWQVEGRLLALFTDSGSTSLLLPFVLVCATISLIHISDMRSNKKNSIYNWIFLFIGIFSITTFSFFAGRSYYLVSFILITIVFFYKFHKLLKKRILSFIGFLILTFAFLYFLNPVFEKITKQVYSFSWALFQGDFLDAFENLDRARFHFYAIGVEIFKNNPLFGTGINSFMVQYNTYNSTTIPIDNPGGLFIGILSDFGILGMTMIIAWFFLMQITWNNFQNQQIANDLEIQFFRLYFILVASLFAPSFFGYHILYPEYCALIISAFLFSKTK